MRLKNVIINKIYKKISTLRTEFKLTSRGMLFLNNIYTTSHGKIYTKSNYNTPIITTKKKSIYVVYKNIYQPHIKLYVINNILEVAIMQKPYEIDNILYSLRHPELYAIKFYMKSHKKYQIYRENIISAVTPSNKPGGLYTVSQIPSNPFVNIKRDGVTAIVGFLPDFGVVVVDTRDKIIWVDKEFKIKKLEVYLGEYIVADNIVYLFVDTNDFNKDFRVDVKNMKHIIKLYNSPTIQLNYIELARTREDYKAPTRRLLTRVGLDIDTVTDMKFMNSDIKLDGLIYGNINTRAHYKWKPQVMNTIDFYVKYKNKYVYFYAGQNKSKAVPPLRNIPFPWRIGNKKYAPTFFMRVKGDEKMWKKYDGMIVECKYENGIWVPYRIRDDKPYPNHYPVAVNIMKIIKSPISITDLI